MRAVAVVRASSDRFASAGDLAALDEAHATGTPGLKTPEMNTLSGASSVSASFVGPGMNPPSRATSRGEISSRLSSATVAGSSVFSPGCPVRSRPAGSAGCRPVEAGPARCPRNAGLVAGRGGVYARNETWISAALPDRGRTEGPSLTRGSRSQRLKERQAGRSLSKVYRVSRKGAMSSLPRGVSDVSEFVLDEMGLEVVLDRVLESAKELTGARYAALCVLNDARDGLAVFLTAGIDNDTRARIGKSPCGRGVLGDLILDPVPLRLANLGEHRHCYGMPPGHPPMRSFLGVPILVDHMPDGSLCVTEKSGGRTFSDEDQEAVAALAGFAGLAIERDRGQTNGATF